MAPLRTLACWLAQTKFGQKALKKPEGLPILKQPPGARVYVGLFFMAMSYLTVLPALACLSYLSLKLSRPAIIAGGGPLVFLLVHIMFGLGVYLAGQNYAMALLLCVTQRFLKKYA